MSKIQEFIDAWNSKIDQYIVEDQIDIDEYKTTRLTAISLNNPIVLKIPTLKVEGISGNITIDGFDVTTLGQLFEWSYPIDGINSSLMTYGMTNFNVVDNYRDYKITDTKFYIDGYTYGTMSYIAGQYVDAINSQKEINLKLRRKINSFRSLDSYKKLKDMGGKVWFDNYMHSLYSSIFGLKISVSKLKYSDYEDISNYIDDALVKQYLKGFYSIGSDFDLGSGEQSKYYQAILEAGDHFFTGTQSSTQSISDYKLSVIDPKSDNDKKIEGVINFSTTGPNISARSVLNGLPNPYTNTLTNLPVENNTGSISWNSDILYTDKKQLSDNAVLNLQNMIISKYGLNIALKYEDVVVNNPTDTASQSSATPSILPVTTSIPPSGEYTFDVQIIDTFYNPTIGFLTITGKQDTTFIYNDYGDDELSQEYTEEGFIGEDEKALEIKPEEIDFELLNLDMAASRVDDTSTSGTNGNFEAGATISPSKLKKSMTFVQVTEAVISNLEGGYFHPDMTKDGRIKDSRYSTSGETMFGLDRKQGDSSSSAAKEFWSLIDSAGARSKWKWNFMPKQPLYTQLVEKAAGVMEPKFNSSLSKYCPDKNLQAIIKSDGRLMFNVIYAQWNGVGWIKGLLKLIVQEYNNGKKDAESLLKATVIERVNGGNKMYNLGTGKNLGSRSASLIAQGGKKIAKLTGVQVA